MALDGVRYFGVRDRCAVDAHRRFGQEAAAQQLAREFETHARDLLEHLLLQEIGPRELRGRKGRAFAMRHECLPRRRHGPVIAMRVGGKRAVSAPSRVALVERLAEWTPPYRVEGCDCEDERGAVKNCADDERLARAWVHLRVVAYAREPMRWMIARRIPGPPRMPHSGARRGRAVDPLHVLAWHDHRREQSNIPAAAAAGTSAAAAAVVDQVQIRSATTLVAQ